VSENLQKHKRTCVIGGDHSCALGTWSGVYDAYHQQGDIGLIWFDAHMDAHTPETTPSGHIHGMPVAALLGFGYPTLTSIAKDAPKFKPQNVCYIGVRSYESGEAELLKKLNVKVYYMEEVLRRGFQEILQEAVYHVSQHTVGYGLSLDLDGIDPRDAPGVDVPEPNGVRAEDLMLALPMITNDPRLLLTEIVEFDPTRDRDRMTEKLFAALIEILAGR
jgi:arginase